MYNTCSYRGVCTTYMYRITLCATLSVNVDQFNTLEALHLA